MEVSAGSQKPALVMRQTVAHKEDVVFLARLPKCLSQLRLLIFDWGQYKRRGIKLDWAGSLWVLEGHLDAGGRPKSCEGLNVDLCGQRSPALAVHRKCHGLQVLNVENLFVLHCLQHVLARHNLENERISHMLR